MPPGCSLYTRKHLLDFGVVKISPVYEHASNFLRVGNILKRIRAEQHHIRNPPFLDRAKLPLHSKEARGIERGSLQRFERREPGRDESLQLFVQAEAGEDVYACGRVRSRKEGHSRLMQHAHDLQFFVDKSLARDD